MKKKVIFNKQIRNKYIIEKKIIAGISLKGWEVKSIKYNSIDINNSYIKIKKNKEIYLIGLQINSFKYVNKCLIKKREIKILINKKEIYYLNQKLMIKGYTLILISFIIKNPWYKIKIGLAKGMKKYDIRNKIKKKQWNIKKKKILKNKIKIDL